VCDVTRSRRITIRYDGGSSGSGPLTFGQDNMIRCIRFDAPEQINKQGTWPVPDGTSMTAATAALRTLAERHETLRTVFPSPADDPEGFPERQEVHAQGRFSVEAIEAGQLDPTELTPFAEELGRKELAVRFDLSRDFPLRCTLLTDGERVLRMVVVASHAAVDGVGTTLLIQEWAQLAAGAELPPVTSRTPLEVAVAERSRAGLRRAQSALRHWERVLRTSPHAVFADSRLVRPPGELALLICRSRAAARALEAASRRTGATPSTVLLAAFAALVAHRAAQPGLVIAALSANRHRPGLADHRGTIAQDGLLALDAGAADLDELIGRTRAASLTGFLNSTFDAQKVWQMIEDTAHRRGARFARHVVVNDLSLAVPEAVLEARPAGPDDPEITWLPDERLPTRVMFNILRVSGRLEFALLTCPQVFDREETEQFVHGLLALVGQAAQRSVPLAELGALTGVGQGVRTGEWRRLDNSWIDLDAVRELLASVLGPGGRSRVEVERGRLVARVAGAGAGGPERLHQRVMSVLQQYETAMAPQHYVVHEAAGADPGADWGTLPVLAEGDGRDPDVPDWEAVLR
jgi:Condensation domain